MLDFEKLQGYIEQDSRGNGESRYRAVADECVVLDIWGDCYEYLRRRFDHETALALVQARMRQHAARMVGL